MNWLNYKKIFFVSFAFTMHMPQTLWSLYRHVHSEKQFYSRLEEFPFSIVLFVDLKNSDKPLRRSIASQKDLFKRTSSFGFYQEAQLQFLVVEINSPWMTQLTRDYSISATPAFMLFVDGLPLKNGDDSKVIYQGFACEQELRTFIKEHLQEDLEKNLQRRAHIKQDAREQAEYDNLYAPSAYVNFSYNPVWGDPYYGYPYYGGNYGYWNSCGLRYGGWGGYNGYGGYGPGFGFGVTVPVR